MSLWRNEWRILSAPLAIGCVAMAVMTAVGIRNWNEPGNLTSGVYRLDHSIWSLALALYAMALAVAQGLANGDLDHRALARMRAISDVRQHASTCTVGLGAYLLGVALPLVLAIIWNAWFIPAPFLPGALVPIVIDVTAGMLCYLGVQCVFLSSGSWLTRGSYALSGFVLYAMIIGRWAFPPNWWDTLSICYRIEQAVWILIALAALGQVSWRLFKRYGDLHAERSLWTLLPAGTTAVAAVPLLFWVLSIFGFEEPYVPDYAYLMDSTGGVAIQDGTSIRPFDPARSTDEDGVHAPHLIRFSTVPSERADDFHLLLNDNTLWHQDAGEDQVEIYAPTGRPVSPVINRLTEQPATIHVGTGFPEFPRHVRAFGASSLPAYLADDGRPWLITFSGAITVKGAWTHGMPLSIDRDETTNHHGYLDPLLSTFTVLTPDDILCYSYAGVLIRERHLPVSITAPGPLQVQEARPFNLYFTWDEHDPIVLQTPSQERANEWITRWVDVHGDITHERHLPVRPTPAHGILYELTLAILPPALGPESFSFLSWHAWHDIRQPGSLGPAAGSAFARSCSAFADEWQHRLMLAALCSLALGISAYHRTRRPAQAIAWLILGLVFGAGGIVGYVIHRPAWWRMPFSCGHGRPGPGTHASPGDSRPGSDRQGMIQISEAAA